ncbi:MBL fold metallo-hydrolase [Nocardioides gansuensis]|uniref:MBL fold metallo-hydrolase n=1 Tax=Nocardioides gansuensis TaxID=2138300 RepID=UPI001BA9AB58|nr:MBL fold metallo-hydrolase [Nocardioides gansuensis]
MDLDNRSHAPAPVIRATAFVGRWPKIPWPDIPDATFPPTTATLISGPTEAVLIDAMYLKADVQDLGDLIERTGKTLTTIYITHAHADHYAGLGPLLERFPSARCVAMPHVVEAMREGMELHNQQWEALFGDTYVIPGPLPEPMEGRTLFVDGSPVEIIEVKQADIHPTSIVHVPEAGVVVAGDSVYNEIYPMLGLSTPEEWSNWLETVALVESLNPRMIVAGHRRPDGDDHAVQTMIAQTRAYIQDFAAAYEVAKNAEDLVAIMTAKYPHHGNLWSLQFSAGSVFQFRETGATASDDVPVTS